MLSISAYGEAVGCQIARVALDHDLRDRVCPDQGPGGWRVVPQFAGAPDFRDRQLLHRSRSQLRRPLTYFDPAWVGGYGVDAAFMLLLLHD